MKNSSELQTKIKETYEHLEDKGYVIGQMGKISLRLEDNTILEYPVKNNFDIKKVEESEVFSLKKDTNVVITMHAPHTLALSVLNEPLPCATAQMASVIGGNVSYTYSDNVKAILLKNRGAYCLGDTLEQAVLSCKVLESAATVYLTLTSFGNADELTEAEIKKYSTL